MRIQTQDRVHAYPKVYPVRPIRKVSRIEPVCKVQHVENEEALGEKIILSETAELLIKIFVYSIGPLYVGWLVFQAVRVWGL